VAGEDEPPNSLAASRRARSGVRQRCSSGADEGATDRPHSREQKINVLRGARGGGPFLGSPPAEATRVLPPRPRFSSGGFSVLRSDTRLALLRSLEVGKCVIVFTRHRHHHLVIVVVVVGAVIAALAAIVAA